MDNQLNSGSKARIRKWRTSMTNTLTALSATLLFLVGGVLLAQAPTPAPTNEAETKAIAKIRELGGQVMEIAQNDNHLEVSYATQSKVNNDSLVPVKDLIRMVHLN